MSLGPIATLFLLPPVNLLPLALGGLVLSRWRRRLGVTVTAAALVLTWLLSLGVVSTLMIRGLEAGIGPPPTVYPEAIVILSAESKQGDRGGLVVGFDAGPLTLERLRAGARLVRTTRLPVLTSGGGGGENGRPALAEIMAYVLKRDFAVSVQWMETKSDDTWENAAASAAILLPENIHAVYVVTDAWHMRRAVIAFRHAGLQAVPAPVRMQPPLEYEVGSFLPTPQSWLWSYLAIHEWIGCAVYALRARFT
jgi:uncharacterized SAM-binding protein YcdF (DUF218 family)